jgi:hypothetical protein
MATAGHAFLLSEEQLEELLALSAGADSFELKLTVPGLDHRATVEALGIDPLGAVLRQVFFFDTPGLDLDKAGVVARARRTQGKPDDSVVKLRPVVPESLSPRVRDSNNLVVEVDAMPGGFVCSASLKGQLDSLPVRDVTGGKGRLSKLFSKEQRAFFAEHAPNGLELDDLSILGPVHCLKLKYSPEGAKRRLVVELWIYPGGSQILELSTKCKPKVAFQVAAEARAYLAGRGVDLLGEQQTKTRTALEFFARELADGN